MVRTLACRQQMENFIQAWLDGCDIGLRCPAPHHAASYPPLITVPPLIRSGNKTSGTTQTQQTTQSARLCAGTDEHAATPMQTASLVLGSTLSSIEAAALQRATLLKLLVLKSEEKGGNGHVA